MQPGDGANVGDKTSKSESTPSIEAHETRIRVRYAECDAMGYLHHAKYWEYFEEARTEMLRGNGVRYRDLEKAGVFFVVYKCSCTYGQPVRYDDVVAVRVWVTRITRTRVDHAYEIVRDSVVCAKAATTLACVGRDGRPTLMPEALWTAVST